uniref:Uncharacterized protein n=1 Tax=Elaeophora elaphi TaxID=1147741 RepID=A0A0R3S144_9BILA
MLGMSPSKNKSISSSSSTNPALNPTDSHIIDEGNGSLTSSNIKDNLPLSDSSDETENSAMEILDNLIEQLPKTPSIIAKRRRMSSVNDLSLDQPYTNVVKFDTNVHQQAESEAEYDCKLISESFQHFLSINWHCYKNNLFTENFD